MIKSKQSSTNSPIGSYHWFHTHIARIKHIGEFMRDNPKERVLTKEWGASLYDIAEELINGYEDINHEK